MDKDYAVKYYNEEEENWWFVSRRNTILKLLAGENRAAKILDIGCGGGSLLVQLKKAGFANLYGVDISTDAIEKCKERGLDNVFVMDGHNPKFETATFDIIIASDSLEHLENDKEALHNWNTILQAGGQLIIFVPAFMFLWSEHDVVNHHYRRYTSGLLKAKVNTAGFSVTRSGYWNFFMFFPTALYRVSQKILNRINKKKKEPKDQLKRLNPFVNKMLIQLLSFENLFFRSVGLITGVSVFVQAKKSNQ